MSQPHDESTVSPRVPFPRYAIGLLQSESEMLQTPQYDLSAFLAAETELWTVELFTERTVHALLDATNRFDCIVVGYNASHKSREIREALEAWTPDVGMCVLHQLEPAALAFLAGALGLRARRLATPAGPPSVASGRKPDDEILLNWRERVGLTDEARELHDSLAYVCVTPTDGTWRTVLEVQTPNARLPVLVRTRTGRAPPLAVSTALLAPRRASHAHLLRNLMLWCASGRPSVVVVDTGGEPDAAVVQRKLRMQGTRAIVEQVSAPERLDLRAWPFWGVGDVVLPQSWDGRLQTAASNDDRHNLTPWLRRGGRIVVLGPGDGLTIRHGESDAHWVAKRWATWFNGISPAVWHGGRPGMAGSLVATRSILRMLSVLHRVAPDVRLPGQTAVSAVLDDLAKKGIAIDPESLGLPSPSEFNGEVSALLRRRIGRADNIDQTASATITALDIDALLGHEALRDGVRARLTDRLLADRETFAIEDRLELARCLRRGELLVETIESARTDPRLEAPMSATLVTALRSAVVACGVGPDVIAGFPINLGHQVVERELPMRPMLGANYILGVLDLQTAWPQDDEAEPGGELDEPGRSLRDPPEERLDTAMITLGRYGPLARGQAGSAPAVPELASTEALALIAYFAKEAVPTHVLRREEAIAAPLVDAVLEESANLRRENEERVRHERVLRWAAPALYLLGFLLLLEVVAVLWWQVLTLLPIGLQLTFGGLVLTVLTLALIAALVRLGLRLRGVERAATMLGDGWGGVRKALVASIGRSAPPPEG